MLPRDDLQGHLHECPPQVSRSALHRCLVRHGISQIPKSTNAAKPGTFEPTEMVYLHNDSSELRLGAGKQHMFVVSDWMKSSLVLYLLMPQRNATAQHFCVRLLTHFRIVSLASCQGIEVAPPSASVGTIFDRVCYKHNV